MKFRKNKGFTLVELMSVIVIVGLLVAIAVPAYTNHQGKVVRNEMTAKMAEIALQLERNYSMCNAYNLDCFQAKPVSIDDSEFVFPESGGTRFYNVTVELGQESFLITAAPTDPDPDSDSDSDPTIVNAQKDDECGTLTLDNVGEKIATKDGDEKTGCF